MIEIELTTHITAPVERLSDLTRSIDLHARSLAHTGEEAFRYAFILDQLGIRN